MHPRRGQIFFLHRTVQNNRFILGEILSYLILYTAMLLFFTPLLGHLGGGQQYRRATDGGIQHWDGHLHGLAGIWRWLFCRKWSEFVFVISFWEASLFILPCRQATFLVRLDSEVCASPPLYLTNTKTSSECFERADSIRTVSARYCAHVEQNLQCLTRKKKKTDSYSKTLIYWFLCF